MSSSNSSSLPPDDRRSLSLRLTALQALVAMIFAALAVAFWVFQVAQHQKFNEMAENNHRRRLPLPAPRGVLFDRNGKVLVENQNTFNIALDREQSGNIDDTLRLLALAIGGDEATMRETVNRRRREPSYRPIVLVENATQEQVIAFRARRLELPGIISQEVPARQYPQSEMGLTSSGTSARPTKLTLRGRSLPASSRDRWWGRPASSGRTTTCSWERTATGSSSSIAAAGKWARRRSIRPSKAGACN